MTRPFCVVELLQRICGHNEVMGFMVWETRNKKSADETTHMCHIKNIREDPQRKYKRETTWKTYNKNANEKTDIKNSNDKTHSKNAVRRYTTKEITH